VPRPRLPGTVLPTRSVLEQYPEHAQAIGFRKSAEVKFIRFGKVLTIAKNDAFLPVDHIPQPLKRATVRFVLSCCTSGQPRACHRRLYRGDPARAPRCGCCSIRPHNDRASAPPAARHSTCHAARSPVHLYARTVRGCTGVVCRGSSRGGGMQAKAGLQRLRYPILESPEGSRDCGADKRRASPNARLLP
jgi:hypothetical protein